MQKRRVEITYRDLVSRRAHREVIGFAKCSAGFHAALPFRVSASANLSYGSGFLDGEGPQHLPDHTEFSFSLSKSIGERLSVAFTAQNIGDGRYLLDNSNTFGGTHWNYLRQVSGQIRYRFHF